MSTPASYMLIFRETNPEVYTRLDRAQTRECLDRWNAWIGSIAATGALKHGHPLTGQTRLVSGDQAMVSDGPFAEAKETIGGYLLVTAGSLEEVTAIARRCPQLSYGLTIEIREVSPVCHLGRTLGLQSMTDPCPAEG